LALIASAIGGLEGVASRVEQFDQIRRDPEREGLSIRALAARRDVRRRAVRQALAWPVPPVKRAPQSRPARKLGAYRAIIDARCRSVLGVWRLHRFIRSG
jgi:hypothetical protein